MISEKIKLPRKNYYQGVLQLRNTNEQMLVFVYNQVDKRNDVVVTKVVKLDGGLDLYISSQQFIRSIGRKLKEGFGGELKISSRLHTVNRQGRELYRVNVLFRLAEYKQGDIVTIRGDQVKLIKLGKWVHARDLKTGKKLSIRRSDLPKR